MTAVSPLTGIDDDILVATGHPGPGNSIRPARLIAHFVQGGIGAIDGLVPRRRSPLAA